MMRSSRFLCLMLAVMLACSLCVNALAEHGYWMMKNLLAFDDPDNPCYLRSTFRLAYPQDRDTMCILYYDCVGEQMLVWGVNQDDVTECAFWDQVPVRQGATVVWFVCDHWADLVQEMDEGYSLFVGVGMGENQEIWIDNPEDALAMANRLSFTLNEPEV